MSSLFEVVAFIFALSLTVIRIEGWTGEIVAYYSDWGVKHDCPLGWI